MSNRPAISRRGLLRGLGLVTVGGAAATVLAACGDVLGVASETESPTPAATPGPASSQTSVTVGS